MSTNPTLFYIFRHGETEAKKQVPQLVCGRFDSPLTPDGKRQITEKIAPVIKEISFDEVLLSPTIRSRESFEAAYEGFGGELPLTEVVPDLREVDYGIYDGKSIEEFKEAKEVWKKEVGPLDFYSKVGGSESNAEASDRFANTLLDLAKKKKGKKLLLPSHNGVIRALFYMEKIIIPEGKQAEVEVGKDLPFGTLLILESDGETLKFVELRQ